MLLSLSYSLLLSFLFLHLLPLASSTVLTAPGTTSPTPAWHKFEKLLDAKRGSSINGISQLKNYFYQFGYLPLPPHNFTNEFDLHLEHAVTRYQTRHGLPVTGTLDSETLSLIMSPRCGVPDNGGHIHATKRYVYFPGRPRWTRQIPITLTYAFSPDNLITYLSLEDIKGAFKRAFAKWESVIPVQFVETEDYGFADVKIGFYAGDHGDGEPFDGVLGVLAHAFSPPSGKFHLDDAERWAIDFEKEKSTVAVDLESVALHEIGHVLGLGHTTVREAVMYPSLKPREKKLELRLDDIEGVQALYGSNPNFTIGSLLGYPETSSYSSSLNSGDTILKWATFFMAFITSFCS
ncbi:Metalloendoproteinase 4-MMP [Ancistrocladus abbreviatus]